MQRHSHMPRTPMRRQRALSLRTMMPLLSLALLMLAAAGASASSVVSTAAPTSSVSIDPSADGSRAMATLGTIDEVWWSLSITPSSQFASSFLFQPRLGADEIYQSQQVFSFPYSWVSGLLGLGGTRLLTLVITPMQGGSIAIEPSSSPASGGGSVGLAVPLLLGGAYAVTLTLGGDSAAQSSGAEVSFVVRGTSASGSGVALCTLRFKTLPQSMDAISWSLGLSAAPIGSAPIPFAPVDAFTFHRLADGSWPRELNVSVPFSAAGRTVGLGFDLNTLLLGMILSLPTGVVATVGSVLAPSLLPLPSSSPSTAAQGGLARFGPILATSASGIGAPPFWINVHLAPADKRVGWKVRISSPLSAAAVGDTVAATTTATTTATVDGSGFSATEFTLPNLSPAELLSQGLSSLASVTEQEQTLSYSQASALGGQLLFSFTQTNPLVTLAAPASFVVPYTLPLPVGAEGGCANFSVGAFSEFGLASILDGGAGAGGDSMSNILDEALAEFVYTFRFRVLPALRFVGWNASVEGKGFSMDAAALDSVISSLPGLVQFDPLLHDAPSSAAATEATYSIPYALASGHSVLLRFRPQLGVRLSFMGSVASGSAGVNVLEGGAAVELPLSSDPSGAGVVSLEVRSVSEAGGIDQLIPLGSASFTFRFITLAALIPAGDTGYGWSLALLDSSMLLDPEAAQPAWDSVSSGNTVPATPLLMVFKSTQAGKVVQFVLSPREGNEIVEPASSMPSSSFDPNQREVTLPSQAGESILVGIVTRYTNDESGGAVSQKVWVEFLLQDDGSGSDGRKGDFKIALEHPPLSVRLGGAPWALEASIVARSTASSTPTTSNNEETSSSSYDTDAKRYRFEWSILNHPELDLSSSSVRDFTRDGAPSLPGSILALNASVLEALLPSSSEGGANVTFLVRGFDRLSGESSAARATVLVLPPLLFFVSDAMMAGGGGGDPCVAPGALRCENGGRCVATAIAGGGAAGENQGYALRCECPRSPVAFFGATCSFGLLGCPSCFAHYESSSSLRLYGAQLSSLQSIRVAGGRPVSFSRAQPAAESHQEVRALRAGTGFQGRIEMVVFQAPALFNASASARGRKLLASASSSSAAAWRSMPATYQLLTLRSYLTAGSSSSSALELNYTSLLFYSPLNCTEPTPFVEGGQCVPCPSGAFCPGGGRAWPLQGWWSYSEYTRPIRCAIPDACLGVDIAAALSGSGNGLSAMGAAGFGAGSSEEGGVNTLVCAAAYAGPGCQSCASTHFALDNGVCKACPSVDQSATLSAMLFVVVVAMGLLAAAVALLRAQRLATAVQLFSLVQGLALVMVAGVRNLPVGEKASVQEMASVINLVNFDLQLPALTWLRKLQYTLLFMSIAGVFFLVACAVRLGINLLRRHRAQGAAGGDETRLHSGSDSSSEEEQIDVLALSSTDAAPTPPTSALPPFNPWKDWRQRMLQSMLILLALFYLRLSSVAFRAFHCTMAPDAASVNGDASTPLSVREQTYSLYLAEDLQTPCYSGAHLGGVVGSVFIIVFLTLGFPLAAFVLLMRAFSTRRTTGVLGWLRARFACLRWTKRRKGVVVPQRSSSDSITGDGATSDASQQSASSTSSLFGAEEELSEEALTLRRQNMYGFLYLGLRAPCFCAGLYVYLVKVSLAAISVLADAAPLAPEVELCLFGVVWAVQTTGLAIILPYALWRRNGQTIILGLGMMVHSLWLLGAQRHGSGANSASFAVLLTILLLVLLLCIKREWIVRRLLPASWNLIRWADLSANQAAADALMAKQRSVSVYHENNVAWDHHTAAPACVPPKSRTPNSCAAAPVTGDATASVELEMVQVVSDSSSSSAEQSDDASASSHVASVDAPGAKGVEAAAAPAVDADADVCAHADAACEGEGDIEQQILSPVAHASDAAISAAASAVDVAADQHMADLE